MRASVTKENTVYGDVSGPPKEGEMFFVGSEFKTSRIRSVEELKLGMDDAKRGITGRYRIETKNSVYYVETYDDE